MTDDTGSWFPVPSEDSLPEGLRGLFAKARERLGFVPNVFRVYSYRPERLSAWFAHFRALHEPTEDLGGIADAFRCIPRHAAIIAAEASIDRLTLSKLWTVSACLAVEYGLCYRDHADGLC